MFIQSPIKMHSGLSTTTTRFNVYITVMILWRQSDFVHLRSRLVTLRLSFATLRSTFATLRSTFVTLRSSSPSRYGQHRICCDVRYGHLPLKTSSPIPSVIRIFYQKKIVLYNRYMPKMYVYVIPPPKKTCFLLTSISLWMIMSLSVGWP